MNAGIPFALMGSLVSGLFGVLAAPLVVQCSGDRHDPVAPVASGGYGPIPTAAGGAGPIPTAAGGAGSSSTTPSGGASTGGASTGSASTTLSILCDAAESRHASASEINDLRRKLMQSPPKAMKARPKASYVVLDLPSRIWAPLAPTLDQIGSSCVGFGSTQWRVSEPWPWPGPFDVGALTRLAMQVYSDATKMDPFDGEYPPDDTGSNGASGMAALKARGFVSAFQEVVTFEGLQRALQVGPCITGTAWYSGMFTPNRCGQLELTGAIEGYHEWKISGIDYETKRLLGLNTWGGKWGAKDSRGQRGYFWLTFGNYTKLLSQGADIHCGKP